MWRWKVNQVTRSSACRRPVSVLVSIIHSLSHFTACLQKGAVPCGSILHFLHNMHLSRLCSWRNGWGMYCSPNYKSNYAAIGPPLLSAEFCVKLQFHPIFEHRWALTPLCKCKQKPFKAMWLMSVCERVTFECVYVFVFTHVCVCVCVCVCVWQPCMFEWHIQDELAPMLFLVTWKICHLWLLCHTKNSPCTTSVKV